MTEVVDKLVMLIEDQLDKHGIELTINEADKVRDVLDEVLGEYEEAETK